MTHCCLVEAPQQTAGITTVFLQREELPQKHSLIGQLEFSLQADTPLSRSDDTVLTSYPVLSSTCTGLQHLHWRWSFRWLSRFLCWPATWKKFSYSSYSGPDFPDLYCELDLCAMCRSSNCNTQTVNDPWHQIVSPESCRHWYHAA